jgi:uncharacterized protein YlxP (DUF503 family)
VYTKKCQQSSDRDSNFEQRDKWPQKGENEMRKYYKVTNAQVAVEDFKDFKATDFIAFFAHETIHNSRVIKAYLKFLLDQPDFEKSLSEVEEKTQINFRKTIEEHLEIIEDVSELAKSYAVLYMQGKNNT